MSTVDVLVEVQTQQSDALERFAAASASMDVAHDQVRAILPSNVAGNLSYMETTKPIPMFVGPAAVATEPQLGALSAFATPVESPDVASVTHVVPVEVDAEALEDLVARDDVIVWPNSPIDLIAAGTVDCQPFRPGVDVDTIRGLLGVQELFDAGHRGGEIVVGIVDEGVHGATYPVIGGYNRPGGLQPGAAPVTSHGSMCAADVLVAAPDTKLYDYPFLNQRSSSAIAMFSAALEQRRLDGTPHVLSSSWGFYGVPPREQAPTHEIWDLDHPLHRKIREVIASGAPVVFAAGNCGAPCAAGNCQASGIGPGKSIHGSNSLAEVITVAAVNHLGERIGYSSQGPGMFEPQKPDIAAYSHFFGNFGPGRPGGDGVPFDNGTSAACPVVSGVVALLLSAKPGRTPATIQQALIGSAGGPWDPDLGHGVIDVAAAAALL
jgi:serine protease AprX